MAIAVCGTHYSGMGAATYVMSEEKYAHSSDIVIAGSDASVAASHTSLLICYWLLSFSVVRIARKREVADAGRVTQNESTGLPARSNVNTSRPQLSRAPSSSSVNHVGATKAWQPPESSSNRKVHVTDNDQDVSSVEA